MEYVVSLESIVKEFELTQLNTQVSLEDKCVYRADVNRLALQLTGYFDYFECERVQILGLVEHSYLNHIGEQARSLLFEELFKCNIPCLVLARDLAPYPEMLYYATKNDVPIFSTSMTTTDFMGEIIRWLRVCLAQRVTIHGVLIDVYGEGLLLMGESGIGKSETAIELIKRGHRFVADDAVEIKRVSNQTLIGSCPEIIKYFIELRGIGIIDIRQMFGVESIRATQTIDLVIKLETWDQNKEYDRFGLHEEYIEILGNKVTCVTIPVRPGRNLAVICEAAAINHRQKKMGYNAAEMLNERVSNNVKANSPNGK